MLNVTFSLLGFIVFGCVLLGYNIFIFLIFLTGSILYGIWIAIFLKKRKFLDYELFEKQAMNNNKTYALHHLHARNKTAKLPNNSARGNGRMYKQTCPRSMKSLKLQQTQEAGSIFMNEVKTSSSPCSQRQPSFTDNDLGNDADGDHHRTTQCAGGATDEAPLLIDVKISLEKVVDEISRREKKKC